VLQLPCGDEYKILTLDDMLRNVGEYKLRHSIMVDDEHFINTE
jgi:hypothetical protein